tara:strand:+ start:838 stop:1497 length:660 start_codon:yes stop_codon:yes gene_type:complete
MQEIRNDQQNSDFTVNLNSLNPVKAFSTTAQGATNKAFDYVVPFSEPLIIPANAEVALSDFHALIDLNATADIVRNQQLEAYIEIPELMLHNYMVMNSQGALVKGSYLPNKIQLPVAPFTDAAGLGTPLYEDDIADLSDPPFVTTYTPINNPEPLYLNQMSVRIRDYQGRQNFMFTQREPNLAPPDTEAGSAANTNGIVNAGGTNVVLNIRRRGAPGAV